MKRAVVRHPAPLPFPQSAEPQPLLHSYLSFTVSAHPTVSFTPYDPLPNRSEYPSTLG